MLRFVQVSPESSWKKLLPDVPVGCLATGAIAPRSPSIVHGKHSVLSENSLTLCVCVYRFRVKSVIGIGVGAGAYILTKLAVSRTSGLINK